MGCSHTDNDALWAINDKLHEILGEIQGAREAQANRDGILVQILAELVATRDVATAVSGELLMLNTRLKTGLAEPSFGAWLRELAGRPKANGG